MSDNLQNSMLIAHQMTIFCAKHALLKQCIAFFDRLSDIDVFCESVATVSIEFAHQAIRQKVQKTRKRAGYLGFR